MQKISFTDNSYIEKNESGYIAVGCIANELNHIRLRAGCEIESIVEALSNIKNGALIIANIE